MNLQVAHNDLGEANVAAEEVIGYSGEDVPTDPPTNLEVNTIIGPRSAMLSWDKVNPKSVRGDFKGNLIEIPSLDLYFQTSKENFQEKLRNHSVLRVVLNFLISNINHTSNILVKRFSPKNVQG